MKKRILCHRLYPRLVIGPRIFMPNHTNSFWIKLYMRMMIRIMMYILYYFSCFFQYLILEYIFII